MFLCGITSAVCLCRLVWRARAACCKWVTAPPLLLLASMSLAETLLRLIQGEIMGPATPNPLKTHNTSTAASWQGGPVGHSVDKVAKGAAICSLRPYSVHHTRCSNEQYSGCIKSHFQFVRSMQFTTLTNQAWVMGLIPSRATIPLSWEQMTCFSNQFTMTGSCYLIKTELVLVHNDGRSLICLTEETIMVVH